MSRNVNIVILCEDRQHEAFARRFLAQAGKGLRVQRVEVNPKGRGSGEQFVRARFAKELAYYRQRQHRVEQALVVVIDADRRGIEERVSQIDDAATEGGQERRRADERVALFIPARNIETWLAYLDGQTVNEDDAYPRLERERDCQRHVEMLYEMCQHHSLRPPAPPSLEAACAEYRDRLQA
ncbi:MAG: hypothetical protein GXY83_41945 [Rhodopirellula sp.]|jgi:hypothetical protein|nr:hypothetical protein [Rhodopirellula sp.]